jgi:hypothetical protein
MTTVLLEPFSNTASPIAMVVKTIDQTFVSGVEATVTFDTAEVNETGAFDFTNHRYVCRKAGLLQVGGSANVIAAAPQTPSTFVVSFQQRRNGADFKNKRIGQYNDINLSFATFGGTVYFNVDVGDTIEMRVLFVTTSSAVRVNGYSPIDLTLANFLYIT